MRPDEAPLAQDEIETVRRLREIKAHGHGRIEANVQNHKTMQIESTKSIRL